MVNGEPPAPELRCRAIAESDLESVADLLKRGFGLRRSRAFWQRALACLERRPVPSGMPRYGYLLENAGAAVGAILVIGAVTPGDGALRANVSSWYVEPAFRGYAPLLAAHALKRKDVTYLNITPVRHTWPILAAQGYERYSDGILVAAPALQRARAERVRLLPAEARPDAPHAPFESALLAEHSAYGCTSFWCVTGGRALPFVFRPRMVKGAVPCAQLIYCADVADLARFAGPIGRYLARCGRPFVIVDANGPIAGLVGKYLPDVMPKFFRGPARPRLGDLAHTEAAMFGA